METFFMLFTLVFAPFLWYLSRMFRYTNETVGPDSPVYKVRTYKFSASQYFSDFLKIANPVMVIIMLVGVFITGKSAIRHQEPLLFLFAFFFFAFAGFVCFVIYFDWQYWTITRNVVITFNPLERGITVDGPTQHIVLTPGDVVRIEYHQKDQSISKMLDGYGYFLFYTTDGQITRINNIFFKDFIYIEFLERFFPNTPITIVEHRLPWPTDLNQTENTNSPNFAA